jgi:hypothetical protein
MYHGLRLVTKDLVDLLCIAIGIMRTNNDLSLVSLQDAFEYRVHILLLFIEQFGFFSWLRQVVQIENIINILVRRLILQGSVDGVPLLVIFQDSKGCRVTFDTLLEFGNRIACPGSVRCAATSMTPGCRHLGCRGLRCGEVCIETAESKFLKVFFDAKVLQISMNGSAFINLRPDECVEST